jgi:SAM-dependent methyltransferase
VLDVLFDDHRVWSVDLDGAVPGADGGRDFPWPDALARRLDGHARVELRAHGSPEVVCAAECQFGSSSDAVDLTDSRGRLLSLSKWGRLNQSFADLTSEQTDWYLDRTQALLDVLTHDLGRPAFLAYGSLLGAVRSGRFIGHDMDVDLGYVAAAQTPVDAVRESFAMERRLRRLGWHVRRQNGGFLQLFVDQPDGGTRNLDVFTLMAEPTTHRLYLINDTMVDGDRTTVLPLGSVPLEGRTFPAPREREVLLEGAYGPGWRVPDPGFSYGASPGKRQMKDWFGGFREDRDRWNRFYRDTPELAPQQPSEFADWVLARLGRQPVVDIGCGMGRDTRRFGRRRRAVGLDVSAWAVRRAQRRTGERNRARYEVVNLGSLRETLVAGALLARRLPLPRVVTAHEALDAMSPAARENLWPLCRMLLGGGGRAYLQFACGGEAEEFRDYPTMRRVVLDPDSVAADAARHGGNVESMERWVAEDEGLAMCRMELTWA